MASGGMVLVLDDMANGKEVTVSGIVDEFIQRMSKEGMCIMPPVEDRYASQEMWQKWSRWGVHNFHSKENPQPITYAAAFDPDAWKRTSLKLIQENNINLRLHSVFTDAIVEGDVIKGVICYTKTGREAILGNVVIDSTGDLDVAASAGADFVQGSYMVTTVFRLANVDTDEAERFEYEEPDTFATLNREARRIIGGAWDMWWLKTPIPGIIWCNCPHMPNYDGMSSGDLTAAEYEGRERIERFFEFIHAKLPGFETSYMLGTAEQIGVRQTRLLKGEYIVTKDDVVNRTHFADTVCRGRDYYTPYRSLLPKNIDQLIVAGRHYSAEPEAQKMSREIPPCMVQGEAAGVATSLALNGNVTLREVDATVIQKKMRAQGADPGDVPSENANGN